MKKPEQSPKSFPPKSKFLKQQNTAVKKSIATFKVKTKATIKFTQISVTQPAITCSKLTIKTLEQSVKYFQS